MPSYSGCEFFHNVCPTLDAQDEDWHHMALSVSTVTREIYLTVDGWRGGVGANGSSEIEDDIYYFLKKGCDYLK